MARLKFGDVRVGTDGDIVCRDKTEYGGYRILDVGWKPKHGPYPEFHGALSISQDAIEWSRLDLDGEYRPPFGVVGMVFDAALGHRIASATAEELLEKLKAMIVAEPVAAATSPPLRLVR